MESLKEALEKGCKREWRNGKLIDGYGHIIGSVTHLFDDTWAASYKHSCARKFHRQGERRCRRRTDGSLTARVRTR